MSMTDAAFLRELTNFYPASKDEARHSRFEAGTEILHAALGIAGEAGEVVDIIKKHYAYGKPMDTMKLMEELGDLTHYITRLADLCGLSMPVVKDQNIAKLKKRYPEGYTDQAAIQRADKE